MEKTDDTEIRGEIWHQLVKKFITVATELCILDNKNRVLLIYRKDREFDGYHLPGSVVNNWETGKGALSRLIFQEVTVGVGSDMTEPEPLGWLGSSKDAGPAEPSSRHGVLLLHVARFSDAFLPREVVAFYDLIIFHKTH
ncbi:MAG TPA: NUDIX hydrolase [Candidatus Paceibacterota bacterium]|nr:NUDIX hydrolase [Candidatus Paceibacterota bacterium]HMO82757.1 NUDIX hydrolase [Candidatus Paceibacterota bacterium]